MSATVEAKRPSSSAPDYTKEPAQYLMHHGWEPWGPPGDSLTQWLDPEHTNLKWVETKEQRFAANQEGEVLPVMCKNGKGQTVPVFQTRCTPPAILHLQSAALAIQILRDRERMAAERAEKKAG